MIEVTFGETLENSIPNGIYVAENSWMFDNRKLLPAKVQNQFVCPVLNCKFYEIFALILPYAKQISHALCAQLNLFFLLSFHLCCIFVIYIYHNVYYYRDYRVRFVSISMENHNIIMEICSSFANVCNWVAKIPAHFCISERAGIWS